MDIAPPARRESRASNGDLATRFIRWLDRFVLTVVPRPVAVLAGILLILCAPTLLLAAVRDAAVALESGLPPSRLRIASGAHATLAALLLGIHVVAVPFGKTWRFTPPALAALLALSSIGSAFAAIESSGNPSSLPWHEIWEMPVAAQIRFVLGALFAATALSSTRRILRSRDIDGDDKRPRD